MRYCNLIEGKVISMVYMDAELLCQLGLYESAMSMFEVNRLGKKDSEN